MAIEALPWLAVGAVAASRGRSVPLIHVIEEHAGRAYRIRSIERSHQRPITFYFDVTASQGRRTRAAAVRSR